MVKPLNGDQLGRVANVMDALNEVSRANDCWLLNPATFEVDGIQVELRTCYFDSAATDTAPYQFYGAEF